MSSEITKHTKTIVVKRKINLNELNDSVNNE